MSVLASLFQMPGEAGPSAERIRRQAAAAHESLFALASADLISFSPSLQVINTFLRVAPPSLRRRPVCHPLFIEGLHRLAPHCSALRKWHDSLAPPIVRQTPLQAVMGNVALALSLQQQPDWKGRWFVRSDSLGRVRFPFSSWTVALSCNGEDLVERTILVCVNEREMHWKLEEQDSPFLVLSRRAGLQLLGQEHSALQAEEVQFSTELVRARLCGVTRLAGTPVRYEPVVFADSAHAGLTGGLIERLLQALALHSPGIHAEFVALMHTIRGFELPPQAFGTVQSFSDPSLPGVMGFNCNYTADEHLCLDPLCFTWLGHELGHTKNYLIDNILYAQGRTLVRNPHESTGHVPRYGRAISIRTLFQIPYVHLYELAVLLHFMEGRFAGLPWKIGEEWLPFGEDLLAEIEESFERIGDQARLTAAGATAKRRFEALFEELRLAWRSMQARRRVCL